MLCSWSYIPPHMLIQSSEKGDYKIWLILNHNSRVSDHWSIPFPMGCEDELLVKHPVVHFFTFWLTSSLPKMNELLPKYSTQWLEPSFATKHDKNHWSWAVTLQIHTAAWLVNPSNPTPQEVSQLAGEPNLQVPGSSLFPSPMTFKKAI